MTVDVPDEAVERAKFGLQFAAEEQGVHVHLADLERMARITLVHALGSQTIMLRSEHTKAMEDKQRRINQVLSRAAAAENAEDRAFTKIQAVLHRLADGGSPGIVAMAVEMAAEVGVVLHLGPEAIAERASLRATTPPARSAAPTKPPAVSP